MANLVVKMLMAGLLKPADWGVDADSGKLVLKVSEMDYLAYARSRDLLKGKAA